jgi:hypothetical protein
MTSPTCYQQDASFRSSPDLSTQEYGFRLTPETDSLFIRSSESAVGVLIVDEVFTPEEAVSVHVSVEHPDPDVLKKTADVCLSSNRTRLTIDIRVRPNSVFMFMCVDNIIALRTG